MSYLSAVIVCQEHYPDHCASCPLGGLCKGQRIEAIFERINEMSAEADRWLARRITKKVETI
jgi:hypothetical protein